VLLLLLPALLLPLPALLLLLPALLPRRKTSQLLRNKLQVHKVCKVVKVKFRLSAL
jgi:hypothetical protein